MIIGYTKTDIKNWCSSSIVDLWGADIDVNSTGTKSIYDPCPKGWRVADPAGYVQASMDCYGKTLTVTNYNVANIHGIEISTASGVRLHGGGSINGVLSAVSPETDGCLLTNNSLTVATANARGRWWTNKASGTESAYAFMVASNAAATGGATGFAGSNFRCGTHSRDLAAPVRCQVDTDNR